MPPPTDLLPPLADPDGDAVLVARLRGLGAAAVAPEVEERHLRAMRRQSATRSRRRRAVVAGVAAGAVLLGSTSLAAAGVLPAPAQSAAHRTLGRLGIAVPAEEAAASAAEETARPGATQPAPGRDGRGLGGATGADARRRVRVQGGAEAGRPAPEDARARTTTGRPPDRPAAARATAPAAARAGSAAARPAPSGPGDPPARTGGGTGTTGAPGAPAAAGDRPAGPTSAPSDGRADGPDTDLDGPTTAPALRPAPTTGDPGAGTAALPPPPGAAAG